MKKSLLLLCGLIMLSQNSYSMCSNGLETVNISSKQAREFVKEVLASNTINKLAKGQTKTENSCSVTVNPHVEDRDTSYFSVNLQKIGSIPFYNLGKNIESRQFFAFEGDISAVVNCGSEITDSFREVRNILFFDKISETRVILYNSFHPYKAKLSVDYFDKENELRIIDEAECTSI